MHNTPEGDGEIKQDDEASQTQKKADPMGQGIGDFVMDHAATTQRFEQERFLGRCSRNAGNIFRGEAFSRRGMDRCAADGIGMLATVMNALALREALEALGMPAEVQSAVGIPGLVEVFDVRRARAQLKDGHVVLFAGGTGHPFFTTDTTAALRACEIGADVIIKGTKVDGIYSADPAVDPTAVRYTRISFAEALAQRLRVMDSTAFSLCMDNALPIAVFRFGAPGELARIVKGDLAAATLVSGDD